MTNPNSENKNNFNQQVKELFSNCVDHQAERQKQQLEESTASDEVKSMVKSLLGFESSNDSHLTGTIKKSVHLTLGDSVLQADDLIDNYRLVKPLGVGGQGEVWLARRNDGDFTHFVAIKFIKLAHNENELNRFKTERELLASLQHPNIAQIIGGGTYQNNRLYMVLEWVDGQNIVEYARKNLSSIKDYLACFEQVCKAVSFAHSNGIIHRDIKPSNLIVTKEGTVKLLDFGIAKNFDAELTQTKSAMMMTFAYSSPEQIKGQPVSTATDIYALGLVLYELLTCKKAQQQNTGSHADMIKHITDITPTTPSQVTPDFELSFSPKKLQGDLDNLIMMAIRKEANRRYATVKDIVTDINSYLNSKPLIASGDSVTYKFNKLLKRNPAASIFAAVVLVFLIVLPVNMYTANQEIKLQRDLANESTDFLINILKSASPLGVNGKETKLSDVLAQGERQIEFAFKDQLPLKAKMYDTLGVIEHNIGNNEKAIKYYQKSENIYAKINDPEGQIKSLGQQAIYATRLGEKKKARESLSKADVLLQKVSNPKVIAWHQMRKATLMHEDGDFEGSRQLLFNTLQMLETENIKDDEIFGRLYHELAISTAKKDKVLSLSYHQKSLELAKASVGYNHPIYQSRLLSSVHELIGLRDYEKARQVLDESLLLAQRLFSKNNQRYANVLVAKGYFHHDLGEFEQAELAYKQSRQIFKNIFGKDNATYASITNNLAYLYEDMVKYQQAEKLYRQSIDARRRLDPDNIMRIVSAEANLARLLVKLGKYEQAAALMPHVIEQYALKKRNNLYNQLIVAAITIENGQNEAHCEQGLDQINQLLPQLYKQSAKGWRRMYAELWIGEMYMRCGKPEKANQFLKDALDKSKLIYQKGSMGQKIIALRYRIFTKDLPEMFDSWLVDRCTKDSKPYQYAHSLSQKRLEKIYMDFKKYAMKGQVINRVTKRSAKRPVEFEDLKYTRLMLSKGDIASGEAIMRLSFCMDKSLDIEVEGLLSEHAAIYLAWGELKRTREILWKHE